MADRLQHKIKIRRGKRTDIPALRALLNPAGAVTPDISKHETRYWRRLAADPSLDFYVAEYAGRLQGLVLVCYIRRLDYHGWCAVLDFALSGSVAEDLRDDIGQALINFAKTRARKRGCQQLVVHPSDADSPYRQELLKALLTGHGFQSVGSLLSCPLSENP